MQTLDIHLLRSFVAISRCHSIKVAADLVGRTQSAVSMQMQRLESIVGQPLIQRERYGVELTVAGERFLVHAKGILDRHDEALAAMTGKGLHGLLSIGCPEEYMTAFFPELLSQFSQSHANVEVEVICAPTIELRTLIKQRRIDVAFLSVPVEAELDHSTVLTQEEFVWVANHKNTPLLTQKPIPLALSTPESLEYKFACSAIEKQGNDYRIAYASNSFAGLLAITRSGQAISVITRSAVPNDLVIIEDQLPTLPKIDVSIQYGASHPSITAKTFVEFAKGFFAM